MAGSFILWRPYDSTSPVQVDDQNPLPVSMAGDAIATYTDPSGAIYPVKNATATSTADGEFTVVAAVPDKKIRVLALSVSVLTTAGVVSFKAAASGTTIWQLHLALGTPFAQSVRPPLAIFENVEGSALIANNATGVDSFINVAYIEV